MVQQYEIPALETDLKNVAHDLIGTHAAGEFLSHVMDWQTYFNLLIDAQEQAMEAHLNLLNSELQRIAHEEAERRARAFGLSMIALSLVSGPLISWVGGNIQYKFFPKFTEKVQERTVAVRSASLAEVPGGQSLWGAKGSLTTLEMNHNKIHAKVVGDLTGNFVNVGINGTIAVNAPNFTPAKPVHAVAQSSDTMAKFKTNLGNSLLAQAQVTVNQILDAAETILLNPRWGADCLEKLLSTHPAGRKQIMTWDRFTIAKYAYEMICDDIDKERQKWADQSYFYGRTPPAARVEDLKEAFDIELWALWILNEELGTWVTTKHQHASKGRDEAFDRKTWHYKGKTFGNRPLPEAVLRKLADFGVLHARTTSQVIANHQHDYKKQQKRASEPFPPTIREYDEMLKRRWIEDHEEPEHRPKIDVGNEVDTPQEIAALELWAKKHPPKLSKGQLTANRRALHPIKVVHKSGKYSRKK